MPDRRYIFLRIREEIDQWGRRGYKKRKNLGVSISSAR
jgi:hypothetical protein